MKIISDIPYAPDHGMRGLGDLFLPDDPEGAPSALVIHGGGWNAMEKKSLTPVAVLMAECGYAAFNVNYRLIDHAPWPACGDDCIAAAEFLLDAKHATMAPLDTSRILVIGASAGGHLSLWTGLCLSADKVRAIVSIAGPGDLVLSSRRGTLQAEFWERFLRDKVTEERLRRASPVTCVKEKAPPLLCVHSTNDALVCPEQSDLMLRAYEKVGADATLASFDGAGTDHGIWEEGSDLVDTDKRILVSEVKEALRDFLDSIDPHLSEALKLPV